MALPSILPFRRSSEPAPMHNDPFFTLRREMDRLFDEAFRGFGFGTSLASVENAIWSPSVDVRETENGVEVTAELPGVDEKDIELTVAEGVLTLRGEKKVDRSDKGQGWHVVERSHGTFVRSVALPVEVDESKAKAEFKNGVLHISLPAAPEAERKVHRIKVNG